MLSIKEIIDSVSGMQDNSRLSKCATCVTTGIYFEKTDENKELSEVITNKPVATLERHGDHIVCDLQFVSAFDQDLRVINDILKLYGTNINGTNIEDMKEGERKIPYLGISLTALKGVDNIVSLSSPIFWALTSDKVATNPNTIRLLFKVDDVLFYEGELIDESERVEQELKDQRFRTDMNAAYYDRREEELREREESDN